LDKRKKMSAGDEWKGGSPVRQQPPTGGSIGDDSARVQLGQVPNESKL